MPTATMNVMVSYTERERSVPAFEMESEEACKRGEELVKIEAGEDRGWCRRNGAVRVIRVKWDGDPCEMV